MNTNEIQKALTEYIANEVLDGEDIGLEPTTPLIEWGVINSMEIARLVSFVDERFGVTIPSDKITIEHFKTIDAITALVEEGAD